MTPRPLHPLAWWAWALCLGAAAIRTTNPFLLALLVATAGFVVAARKVEAPWSRSFGSFLKIGLAIVVIRLVLQVLFGMRIEGTTLFTLPSVELPSWMAGVSIGGPVTSESLVGALYQGLQLAALLACVGAANSLASPYRLLRSMPAVLYEAGVAITVALSFAPLASASARRVQEARRLRGRAHRGPAGLRGLAMPVLEGSLERSLRLAASMDARGYGRRAVVAPGRRRVTLAALGGGVLAVLVGSYGMLDTGGSSSGVGLPMLVVGGALLTISLLLGGARSQRTRYRPDPWRWPEWLTTASGVAALVGVVVAGRVAPAGLAPSTNPIAMPTLPLAAVVGILLAALPGVATPEPVARPSRAERAQARALDAGSGDSAAAASSPAVAAT